VLRPEEREDRELEVVRVAPEQLPDTVELAVRQAERAVERLVRNLVQRREATLTAASDAPGGPPVASGAEGTRYSRT
jgi:hypothetical protein